LAKGDKIQADLVAGVPDSGVGHAIGYSMESGLPHRRPLTKYTPGYGRSYTPPSQEIRDLVATMKLIPIKEIISGMFENVEFYQQDDKIIGENIYPLWLVAVIHL
jgi:amidophosphoribosyltransferase